MTTNDTPRKTSTPNALRGRSAKLSVLFAGLALSSLAGCSLHSQAPVKEVAYDFSDAHFYDRAYAPSPDYDNAYIEVQDEGQDHGRTEVQADRGFRRRR